MVVKAALIESIFSVLQHQALGPEVVDSVAMAVGEPTGAKRYVKGHNLGEGTYGVVFKAVDTVVIIFCFLYSVILIKNAEVCYSFRLRRLAVEY